MKVNGMLERVQLEILGADPSGAANLVNARIWKNSSDGRTKSSDGTKAVEHLLNDDKIIIGNSVTVAENVRIHRAGVALLQFIAANDATAEGSLSTSPASLSFKFESYTTAGRPAAGNNSRIIHDSDLNVLLVDDGTNWVSTANGTEISQCFINLGTASNTNVIVLSSDTKANLDLLTRKAGALYYATDEAKYYGDDGLNLVELGSGSGEGINYIVNPDAETTADGHVAYKDAAQEVPEDGVGGSPTLSVVRSAVDPLAKTASFLVTKPASNVQGEGIKIANDDFDEADKGKIHIMSFEYDLSAAGANDGDFRVYFKDETNSVIYRVNGEDIKAGKGTHYARVQIPIDCDNGSLIIHCAATHSDAYTFKYDRVSFGPQKIVHGNIATDAIPYTPIVSGLGSGSGTASGSYKRIGDFAVVSVTFTKDGVAGTGTSPVTFTLPSGLTHNYGKLVGPASVTLDASGVFKIQGPFVRILTNEILARDTNTNGNIVGSDMTAGAIYTIEAMIPIAGWSSQSIVSEDFGGRKIEVDYYGNSGQTVNTGDRVSFEVKRKDTAATWNGLRFTATETGRYHFEGSVRRSTTGAVELLARKNASLANTDNYLMAHTVNTNEIIIKISAVVDLNKGDFVDIVNNASSLSLVNSPEYHFLTVNKVENSQQILETELVAARYTSDSGQLMINLSNTTVVYEDLDHDTHNAYNSSTGVYKVPATGKYSYSVLATLSIGASSGTIIMRPRVNGTALKEHTEYAPVNAGDIPKKVSGTFDLNKGDELYFEVYQTTGVNQPLIASGLYNEFVIERVK